MHWPPHRSFHKAIIMLLLFLFHFAFSLHLTINVYSPPSPPIMGITTCTLAGKVKSVKSMTTLKLPQCSECNPTKSPKSNDLNTTLAKISLLCTRFDNTLTVHGSTRGRNGMMDSNLNTSCNLVTLPVPNSSTNNLNEGQLLANQVPP
jgi:hypothetical protein